MNSSVSFALQFLQSLQSLQLYLVVLDTEGTVPSQVRYYMYRGGFGGGYLLHACWTAR